MQFPVYQVPYAGNGMVIGINAIIHVLVSHGVAIGAFAVVVLADWIEFRGRSSHGPEWLGFARRLLKLSVVLITVVGSVTGTGIWFTTSALAPGGIATMLHVFFWVWFVEWIVFLLEVLSMLAYYLLWDRLARHRRLRMGLGLFYMFLALASAFLITGNLGFMLTPDRWPVSRSFWAAFFNPTFVPQLATRMSLACVLGSLVAMTVLLAGRGHDRDFRAEALGVLGPILLVALVLLTLSLGAYLHAMPGYALVSAEFSVLTSRLSHRPGLLVAANLLGLALLVAVALLAWSGRVAGTRRLAAPALLVFGGMVSEFERVREFVRGPYLIPGYMYVSGVLLEEHPLVRERGLLHADFWYQAHYPKDSEYSRGAYLFSRNCSACHTIHGVNDIRDRVAGRSEDGIFVILGHTHEMVPFMPPFSGTRDERRELARFLYQLSRGRVAMRSLSRHIPARPGGTQ